MVLKNMDKRIARGDETYTRILKSAIELISENGISGITASKLSILSNVSKSTIFHHFSSTRAIPEAALKLLFNELLKPIDNTNDDLGTFLKDLGSSFINTLEENIKIYKTFFSFYHESMFDNEYQKLMGDFLLHSKDRLTGKIQELSDRPISYQEAKSISALIIATLDGIGMHIILGGEKEQYLKTWELQAKFLYNVIICQQK